MIRYTAWLGPDAPGESIRQCAAKDPALLIAHHYTRYLGDLSGGQTLRRCAVRHFGLDKNSTQGVAFYVFPEITSAKDFKNMFVSLRDIQVWPAIPVFKVVHTMQLMEKGSLDLIDSFCAPLHVHVQVPQTPGQPRRGTHTPLNHNISYFLITFPFI